MKNKSEFKNVVLFIMLVLFILCIPFIYDIVLNMPYKVNATVSRVDNDIIYFNCLYGNEFTISDSNCDFKIGDRVVLTMDNNSTDGYIYDDIILDYKIVE